MSTDLAPSTATWVLEHLEPGERVTAVDSMTGGILAVDGPTLMSVPERFVQPSTAPRFEVGPGQGRNAYLRAPKSCTIDRSLFERLAAVPCGHS